MKNSFVRNCFVARRNLAFRDKARKLSRKGAESSQMFFEYSPGAQSYPTDVPADGNQTRTVLTNHRFLYRGYLQIAALDLSTLNELWLITWDPTEPVATRPLVIRKSGTWYCYGWDLTKNICVVFGSNGYINTIYTPYGEVTSSGSTAQPLQWSSEYSDTELGLVYYNYRHYNPIVGRCLGMDRIGEMEADNKYAYVSNRCSKVVDNLGLSANIPSIGDPSCHSLSGTCGYSEENNDKVRDLSLAAAGAGLSLSVIGTQSARFVAHAAACKVVYEIYHSASRHRPTCSEAKTDEELDAAIKALLKEIMYRGIYLSMQCDYYLEGSRKKGSAKKEKGHKKELFEKRKALTNCMRKKIPCLNKILKRCSKIFNKK